MLLGSDLARRSAIVLFIRALNVLFALGLSIVLIRSLGLAGYGLYAVYISIFSLVVLPLTSGMPNYIVKEVAPMFAERNGGEIKAVMLFFLRTAAIYMVLVAIVLGALWYLRIGREYRGFAILMWGHVAIQILNAGRSALLRAVGRIVKGQLAERLIQPALTLGLTAGGSIVLGKAFTPIDAIVALLISGSVTLALGGYWIRQDLGELVSEAVRTSQRRDWPKEVVNLSGVGLLGSAFVNGVVLIVGFAGSLETAGIYRVASAVAVVLNYLQEVMVQVVAPRVAQLWSVRDRDGLVRVLVTGAIFNSVAIGLGTGVIIAFGSDILALAYGPAYRAAYTALVILAFANLAYALGGYRELLLNMSGHAREALKVFGVLVPLGLLLCAIGVQADGQAGAAAAVLAFQLATSIWLTVTTVKLTGIDPSIFGIVRKPLTRRQGIVSVRDDLSQQGDS
jgi:O-antigen/teichoic acid export membrane protein